MKNTLLFFAIIIMSIDTSAQFIKGLKQTGGSLKIFQEQSKNEYDLTDPFVVQDENIKREINIVPRFGLFLQKELSIGFGVGYTNIFNRVKYSDMGQPYFEQEERINLLDLEIYVRYHKPLSDMLYLFLEPSVTGSYGTNKINLNDDIDQKIIGFGINIRPGIIIMLSEKFGLETSFGSLGLEQERIIRVKPKSNPSPQNIDNNFGLDLSLRSFRFGLQYYF